MKTKILVPALIAALSLVACADKKHASTKSVQPKANAPVQSTETKTEESKSEGSKSEASKSEEAKSEQPKLINAHGPDLKCTDEFMKAYTLVGSKNVVVTKAVEKALVDIIPVLKGDKLNDLEIGNVINAYNDYMAVDKEIRATFQFPFSCWLPANTKSGKVTLASELLDSRMRSVKARATAAVGSQNIK